jgi:hypothetical protein
LDSNNILPIIRPQSWEVEQHQCKKSFKGCNLNRVTCRNENIKIKLNNVNIFCTRIIHEWNESFKQYLITKHLDLPGLIKQLYNI